MLPRAVWITWGSAISVTVCGCLCVWKVACDDDDQRHQPCITKHPHPPADRPASTHVQVCAHTHIHTQVLSLNLAKLLITVCACMNTHTKWGGAKKASRVCRSLQSGVKQRDWFRLVELEEEGRMSQCALSLPLSYTHSKEERYKNPFPPLIKSTFVVLTEQNYHMPSEMRAVQYIVPNRFVFTDLNYRYRADLLPDLQGVTNIALISTVWDTFSYLIQDI